ncbi:MAG TPA: integrase core domain-containing protein [Candidatus Dormibacteraeota bacterium]|nr:integrase core domain-containing protein [Candidatus Dormibacteraeota bacterium]
MCLLEKSQDSTAFDAQQCVLCGPVCLGIIAEYGHFSRISQQKAWIFSAVETAWRRKRDSNSRYGFVALRLAIRSIRQSSFSGCREQLRDLGIHEVLSTLGSPWQRAYVERVIGSIRRECLDHVIVFHESSLRRTLASYFDYYHRSRTHLSLGKDTPEPRPIQPPEIGSVVAVPQVGGLHHCYERWAA